MCSDKSLAFGDDKYGNVILDVGLFMHLQPDKWL